jgi:hypothetical protein
MKAIDDEKDSKYLLVGLVKDFTLNPKSFKECCINVFHILDRGEKIDLLHRTVVDDIPYCFEPYK